MNIPAATALLNELLFQYREERAPRFNGLVRRLLQLVEDEHYAPLREMQKQRTLAGARGVWLDWLGERLGVKRPSITDPGTRFGFATDSVGYDQAPFDSVFGSFSSRSPISDADYRRILRIRAYQLIEGMSRDNMHEAADGFYPASGDAYTPMYEAMGFDTITGGRANTLTTMAALMTNLGLFSSVGYGGWSEKSDGSLGADGGPTGNNTSRFVYTNLTGITSAFTAQTRGIWAFDTSAFTNWTGTRRLVIRHCLKPSSNDSNPQFMIRTQTTGSSTWTVVATVKAQKDRSRTNIVTGDTILDVDDNSFTCSANGGWIDLVIPIASNVDEVGMTIVYDSSTQTDQNICFAFLDRQGQIGGVTRIVEHRNDPDDLWDLIPFSIAPAGIPVTVT